MDGVFSFLKPPGITSHDAVGIVRRCLREKRVGHSGTLDPMAGGVLPIFVGRAARLIEYTDSFEKTYVAEGCFSHFTDTEDSTGQPVEASQILFGADLQPAPAELSEVPSRDFLADLEQQPGEPLQWEALAAACHRLTGTINQKPSIYSAIKVNGRRAYELAREGKPVDLPARSVHIYEMKLIAYSYPWFTVQVRCSSGTYIRALLRDLFISLRRPGTMTQLMRTAVGPFTAAESISGEELSLGGNAFLLPAERAVMHLPEIRFSEEETVSLKQGKRLIRDLSEKLIGSFSRTDRNVFFRASGPDGFFGIVTYDGLAVKTAKNIFL